MTSTNLKRSLCPAAAAHRGAGAQRDHRSGRHPDGLLGGRSGCVGREPCGHLQHPDDPDHERACHRRRGGRQPVHRPPGTKEAQNAAAQILFILSSFSLLVAAVVVVGRHAILRGIFGSIDAGRDALRRDLFPALGPELPVHRPVQRRCGPVPGAGQQQDQHDVQPCDECGEHRRQRRADLYGFKMGVMGAALASLVSRAIACCAVLYLLQKPGCLLRVDGLPALSPTARLIRASCGWASRPASRTACSRSASCRFPA